MGDEDLDLYDDLIPNELGDENVKLKLNNEKLQERINKLEFDIDKLCKELISMKSKQNALTQNISELYNTAKAEIARKDRIIADLRKARDDVAFRRFNKPIKEEYVEDMHHEIRPSVNMDVLKENIDQIYNRMNDDPKEKSVGHVFSDFEKSDCTKNMEASKNLLKRKSKSPEKISIHNKNGSPSRVKSKSPSSIRISNPNRSRSRNRKRSRSPDQKRGKSPNRKRVRSPNTRKDRSPNVKRSNSKSYVNRSESCKRKIFDLFENKNITYKNKSRSPYRNHPKTYNMSKTHENRNRSPKRRRSRSKSPKFKRKSRSFSPKCTNKNKIPRSKSPSAIKSKYVSKARKSKSPKSKSRSKSPSSRQNKSPKYEIRTESPMCTLSGCSVSTKSRSRSPKIIKRNRRKSRSPVKIESSIKYPKSNEILTERIEIDKNCITINYNPRNRVRKMRISDGNVKQEPGLDAPAISTLGESSLINNQGISAAININDVEITTTLVDKNKTNVSEEEILAKGNVDIASNNASDDKKSVINDSHDNKSLTDLKEERESLLCKINKDLYKDSHPILDMTNYRIPKKQKTSHTSKSSKRKLIEENKKQEEIFHSLIKEIDLKTPNRKELEKYKITSPTKNKTRELGKVSYQILNEINSTALRVELDTRKSIKTAELRHKSKSNKRKDDRSSSRRSSERSEEGSSSSKSTSKSNRCSSYEYDRMKDILKEEYHLSNEKIEIHDSVSPKEEELSQPISKVEITDCISKTVELNIKTENVEESKVEENKIEELKEILPIAKIESSDKNIATIESSDKNIATIQSSDKNIATIESSDKNIASIDNPIIKDNEVFLTEKVHIISNVKVRSPQPAIPLVEENVVNGFTVTENLQEVTYPSTLLETQIEVDTCQEENLNKNDVIATSQVNETVSVPTNLENTSTHISSTPLETVPDTLNKSENSSNVVKFIPTSRRRRCIVRMK